MQLGLLSSDRVRKYAFSTSLPRFSLSLATWMTCAAIYSSRFALYSCSISSPLSSWIKARKFREILFYSNAFMRLAGVRFVGQQFFYRRCRCLSIGYVCRRWTCKLWRIIVTATKTYCDVVFLGGGAAGSEGWRSAVTPDKSKAGLRLKSLHGSTSSTTLSGLFCRATLLWYSFVKLDWIFCKWLTSSSRHSVAFLSVFLTLTDFNVMEIHSLNSAWICAFVMKQLRMPSKSTPHFARFHWKFPK